jgi:hypothetical protein
VIDIHDELRSVNSNGGSDNRLTTYHLALAARAPDNDWPGERPGERVKSFNFGGPGVSVNDAAELGQAPDLAVIDTALHDLARTCLGCGAGTVEWGRPFTVLMGRWASA